MDKSTAVAMGSKKAKQLGVDAHKYWDGYYSDASYLKLSILALKNAIENKKNFEATDVPERLRAAFGKKEKEIEKTAKLQKKDNKQKLLAMNEEELIDHIDSMVLSHIEDFEKAEENNLYLY